MAAHHTDPHASLLAAGAGPYEEAFIRHSIGTGTFRTNRTGAYIIVYGRMYTLDGLPDGYYQAVFKAGFANQSELLNYPPSPEPTFNAPSPVPPAGAFIVDPTKARWVFADGSSLIAPGPAVSYLARLRDQGSAQFWVSAAAFITGGTGRYEGAVGQETSLGSTWFGETPQLKDGTRFEAKVIHTFKVIRREFRGPHWPDTPPPAGGYTPPPAGGYTPPPAGGYAPPPAGGYTPPPEGGYTPPPEGGYTPPPAGGYTPPSEGGYAPPPEGAYTPPPEGGYMAPPAARSTPPSGGNWYTPPQPGYGGQPQQPGYGAPYPPPPPPPGGYEGPPPT